MKCYIFKAIKTLAAMFLLVGLMTQANGQNAARPQIDLPEGPVRSVLLKNCITCHGIDDYAFHALDREGWNELLDSLHKPEQRSFELARADREILLSYLEGTFGSDYIPFPRDYIAPEITEFFSNSDARVFIDRVCTECHELRVFNERHDVDRWRALVVDMRERGARLSDENLERLVEWLGRVRGTNPFE